MTPDSPEIARLRKRMVGDYDEYLHDHPVTVVRREDLRYALTIVDESCRSCAFVDEIRKQGERLNRLYAQFDEVMREHRGEGTLSTTKVVTVVPAGMVTLVDPVVELRTCEFDEMRQQHPGEDSTVTRNIAGSQLGQPEPCPVCACIHLEHHAGG